MLFDVIPCNLQEQIAPVTPVEVVGVIRGSEKPSIFVPANDPSSGQWFYVDVPAIARACGLPENTIYIEDINENVNPSRPYPIPKDVNMLIRSSVMPQDHLNYTLTWYAFRFIYCKFCLQIQLLKGTFLWYLIFFLAWHMAWCLVYSYYYSKHERRLARCRMDFIFK